MKSNFPLILAWIWILIGAAEGCGWRKVDKEERVNFNWDSHILEVKTEEMSSLVRGDKQLEIVFRTEKLRDVLKIQSFYLTPNSVYGDAQVFNCQMMFNEKIYHALSHPLPSGKLRWIFKKPRFTDGFRVQLASTDYLRELSVIRDENKTETLQFGSGDNISLLYRVNSTDGDCVETGNSIILLNKLIIQNLCFNWFYNCISPSMYLSIHREISLGNREKGMWAVKLNKKFDSK